MIAFSPFFAWLWPRLDKAGMNPSLPAKFGWALVLVGAAMGVLQWSTASAEGGALIGMGWLIAAYAVMVAGEMLLSPIGLSAVTTLSVPRVVGLMMGAWFLFSAFGEMIAGRFGTWASIAPEADGSFDVPKALATYGEFFGQMMWIGIAAGVFMLLLSPVLNRLTRPR